MGRKTDYLIDLRPLGGQIIRLDKLAGATLPVIDRRARRSVGEYSLEDIQKKFL